MNRALFPRRLILLPLLFLIALGLFNLRALNEGIFSYLRDALAYSSAPITSINPLGRYASLYGLVRLRNADRYRFLAAQLEALPITVQKISIPQSSNPNLFISFDQNAPLTIFVAHYDKWYDDIAYQGASDNSAAVSVMLAVAREWARRGNAANRAILFTSEEERGLRGATAFLEFARANNLMIREFINFDNIGRGKLAARPLAELPGFSFWLPFIGALTYTGVELRVTAPYARANARLVELLRRAQPNLIVYENFTALGDANIFQANGYDAVMISGDDMYYLQQTWHTYADRIELLDERNLDAAHKVIVDYNER